MTHKNEITIVPEPSENRLNYAQFDDYKYHRKRLLDWAREYGKDPNAGEGYAHETVRTRAYRLDEFYRWVWDQEGRYTKMITPEHATEYLQHLAATDHSLSYKSSTRNAIRMLFTWRNLENGDEIEWDSEIKFTSGASAEAPSNMFTKEEISDLKEAAEDFGSIPHYNSLTPGERSQWKQYLSQRFGKPKDEISKQDWERANGFKYDSLLRVSLDAGLKPSEVAQASVEWIDRENWMLQVPKQDSNDDHEVWAVALSEEGAAALKGWLAEREQYEKYEGRNEIWLTRRGNQYSTGSLNYLLERLCEEAEVPTEHRELTWTSLRDTVGTKLAKHMNLAEVREQLRYESEEAVEKYEMWEIEQRRKTLEKF